MSCQICGKHYTRKWSLEKHSILCEFQRKTNREKQVDKEERQDLPSYQQLVQIVQELSLKQEKMEKEMTELKKWTQKAKKKMNVLQWLNENIHPEEDFDTWVKQINIQETHFTCLMEKTMIETFQQIFEDLINITSNPNHAMQSFCQKTNIIYVFTNTNANENIWIMMTWEKFIKILQQIQRLLLKEVMIWKQKHKQEMLEKDSLSNLYNKMIIKLMSIEFSKTSHSNKIFHHLYSYLKRDLKTLIEYEFE
jgi:hypothetical protein